MVLKDISGDNRYETKTIDTITILILIRERNQHNGYRRERCEIAPPVVERGDDPRTEITVTELE